MCIRDRKGGKLQKKATLTLTSLEEAGKKAKGEDDDTALSLIHISEPTRLRRISYAVFCLKKKRKREQRESMEKKKKKNNIFFFFFFFF